MSEVFRGCFVLIGMNAQSEFYFSESVPIRQDEAARLLRVGRSWVCRLLGTGQLDSIVVNGVRMVSVGSVRSYPSRKRPVGRPRKDARL